MEEELYESFMFKFNLTNIITPDKYKSKTEIIHYYLQNKNMIIVIIDSMCIGIIMPMHIAGKFKYIENILEYDDYETYNQGINIVKIPCEWETRKWSYTKINRFYNWLGEVEDKTITMLDEKIQKQSQYISQSFDYHFLESLCWNSCIED